MILLKILGTFLILTILSALFIYIGYRVAKMIFNPDKKNKEIDKLTEENMKFANANHLLQHNLQKIDDTNQNNYQWYINQLYNIGTYLKMKHNDTFVFDQLNYLTGQKVIEPQKEKKENTNIILDINTILDRILKVGYDGLSEDEKKFLQNQSKQNKE